jgi:hypothetical protein
MNKLTRMEILVSVVAGMLVGGLFVGSFKLLAYVARHW